MSSSSRAGFSKTAPLLSAPKPSTDLALFGTSVQRLSGPGGAASSKIKLCRFYGSFHGCTRGDSCTYRHEAHPGEHTQQEHTGQELLALMDKDQDASAVHHARDRAEEKARGWKAASQGRGGNAAGPWYAWTQNQHAWRSSCGEDVGGDLQTRGGNAASPSTWKQNPCAGELVPASLQCTVASDFPDPLQANDPWLSAIQQPHEGCQSSPDSQRDARPAESVASSSIPPPPRTPPKWLIFEREVRSKLQDACRSEPELSVTQPTPKLDDITGVRCRPDIAVHMNGNPRLVIDVKLYEASSIGMREVHKLLRDAKAHSCSKAALLMNNDAKVTGPAREMIRFQHIYIIKVTLDAIDGDTLLQEVKSIIASARDTSQCARDDATQQTNNRIGRRGAKHRPPRPNDDGTEQCWPVFEWDEDAEEQASPTVALSTPAPSYSHSSTRIPGKEGLLVDTGAVDNLTGLDYIQRQDAAAMRYNLKTNWEQLDKPKRLSGVGDHTKTCTHQATVHGVLETGDLVTYTAPVIPGAPSPIPPLYGLRSMAMENIYFGTNSGIMAMVPQGRDNEIVWPEGTRFRQCEKAPSGHWILVTSHWNKHRSHDAVQHAFATHGAPPCNTSAQC